MTTAGYSSDPIGELSKIEFFNLLSHFGYDVTELKDGSVSLSDGADRLVINVGLQSHGSGGRQFVGIASAGIEYDTDRYLNREFLRDWQAREKLERVGISSFLGGRIRVGCHIAIPTTPSDEVKASIELMLLANRKVKTIVAPFKPVVSQEIVVPGKSPFDGSIILHSIYPEDIDYLRVKLKWHVDHAKEGGSSSGGFGGGKFWSTFAEPLGDFVIFSGVTSPPQPSPRVLLTYGRGTVDRKWLERSRSSLEKIDWARISVYGQSLHIQSEVDLSKGLSVNELVSRVYSFVRRVNGLGIQWE